VIPSGERARILAAVRACHARIVRDVRAHLAPLVARGDWERAMAARGEGVGDLVYEIDAAAERSVERLARDLGRIAPTRLLCEGIGEVVTGRGEPRLRVLVDPVDGTRNRMADLRSAFALTGIAVERGGEPLTTSDIEIAVQTEIPPSDRTHAIQLVASRGEGCRRAALPLSRLGAPSRGVPLRAPRRVDVRSGYYSFLRYLPHERAAIAEIEVAFFERARRIGVDPRRVYDDQWLCAAGQLALVASGRMRMFADLRAHLAARAGAKTIASHPYDVCTALVATEAGAVVLGGDFETLAAPLDLTTDVSVIAFPNEAARRALEPVLRETLTAHEANAVARLRADSARA